MIASSDWAFVAMLAIVAAFLAWVMWCEKE
jgi:hypothetical protein